MTNSKSIELNARQALICAAITGWAGDGPCSWQSPMPEKDILAWAHSYSRSATNEELAQAFQALLTEKLFFLVRYRLSAAVGEYTVDLMCPHVCNNKVPVRRVHVNIAELDEIGGVC